MKCSKASVMNCFLWQKNGGNMIFGNKIEYIYEYDASIPEKLHKKVLLPIFQVWCQAIAYLDLWGAYPLPFEQKIYLFIGPNIYFYKL